MKKILLLVVGALLFMNTDTVSARRLVSQGNMATRECVNDALRSRYGASEDSLEPHYRVDGNFGTPTQVAAVVAQYFAKNSEKCGTVSAAALAARLEERCRLPSSPPALHYSVGCLRASTIDVKD
jgi:hypothetical protein